MGKPAARLTDIHQHGPLTGPVIGPCAPTVLIAGLPAARVSDLSQCGPAVDPIAMGSMTVLIGGLPAARIGDPTVGGGVLMTGAMTVLIGDRSSMGSAFAAAAAAGTPLVRKDTCTTCKGVCGPTAEASAAAPAAPASGPAAPASASGAAAAAAAPGAPGSASASAAPVQSGAGPSSAPPEVSSSTQSMASAPSPVAQSPVAQSPITTGTVMPGASAQRPAPQSAAAPSAATHSVLYSKSKPSSGSPSASDAASSGSSTTDAAPTSDPAMRATSAAVAASAAASSPASGRILNASPKQAQQIEESKARAEKMVDKALERLEKAKTKPDPDVRKVFMIATTQPEDVEKLDRLITDFEAIRSGISSVDIEAHTLQPGDAEYESSMAGYVCVNRLTGRSEGPVHLNFPQFVRDSDRQRAATIVHEVSHQVAETEDYAYEDEDRFEELTQEQHMKNADSIALFARKVS